MFKIESFDKFFETYSNNPEAYSNLLLKKLQRKIGKYFGAGIDRVITFDDYIETDVEVDRDNNLHEMGLELISNDVYTQSPLVDTLRVIFNDNDTRYDLYIIINLRDVIKDSNMDEFNITDIKFAYAKLKKYVSTEDSFELLGELDKKIQIGEISQDFILEFKMELDDFFDSENDDDFKILSDTEIEDTLEEEDAEVEEDEGSDDTPEEFVEEE